MISAPLCLFLTSSSARVIYSLLSNSSRMSSTKEVTALRRAALQSLHEWNMYQLERYVCYKHGPGIPERARKDWAFTSAWRPWCACPMVITELLSLSFHRPNKCSYHRATCPQSNSCLAHVHLELADSVLGSRSGSCFSTLDETTQPIYLVIFS